MTTVALAGNPNTGKSTLFSRWTGLSARTANFPGVTVEYREGGRSGPDGEPWRVLDLPGCYSLTALSREEEVAHELLVHHRPRPDVVVVVVDAANLERTLGIALQIDELGVPVVVALNLMDEARRAGVLVDAQRLSERLGLPVVSTVATTGEGLDALADVVHARLQQREQTRAGQVTPAERHASVAWPAPIAAALRALRAEADGQSDGEMLWWLTADPPILRRWHPEAAARVERLRQTEADTPAPSAARRLAAASRFARVDALLDGVVARQASGGQADEGAATAARWTERLDAVVLHPLWGVVLFLAAMTVLFQAVFAWSDPAIDAIDGAASAAADLVQSALPPSMFRDVLVHGVIAGIGGTLVFLPQIGVLFLGIAVLEDSGYMGRAAFLADRLMRLAGLQGKAFVPLLSAFACSIPGIMAARSLPTWAERLVTILIAPLMTCAARLPVYTMVTAAVFAGSAPVLGGLSLGGLVIAGMYLFGVLMAVAVGLILRRFVAPGSSSALLLELPRYRWPRPTDVARVVWRRMATFVTGTGPVIVALTVVLWALMTFPRVELPAERAAELQAAIDAATTADARQEAAAALERAEAQHALLHSAAGRIGHAIEPAIAPLGFDWRIGIGLIGSFAAREVMVPVMAQVYGRSEALEDDALGDEVGHTMVRVSGLTPLVGVSLMVFFAIALQCLSTVAAIARETRSWRWPAFALLYLNGLAYLCSLAVFQIGSALGLGGAG